MTKQSRSRARLRKPSRRCESTREKNQDKLLFKNILSPHLLFVWGEIMLVRFVTWLKSSFVLLQLILCLRVFTSRSLSARARSSCWDQWGSLCGLLFLLFNCPGHTTSRRQKGQNSPTVVTTVGKTIRKVRKWIVFTVATKCNENEQVNIDY